MNEELQSANEELSTTNDELQSKVVESDGLNADLSNLIRAIRIPVVFLDEALALRSHTPEALSVFRFAAHDKGRALGDIAADVDMREVMKLCRDVQASGAAAEARLTAEDGRVFDAEVVPYAADRGGRGGGGVVLSLQDITEVDALAERSEADKREAELRLAEVEEVYRTTPQAMALLDRELRYVRINRHLAEINGLPVEDHIGRLMAEVVPALGDQVLDPVRHVFETGEPIIDQRVEGTTGGSDGEVRTWECDWYPVRQGGEVVSVGVNVRDITDDERRRLEYHRLMQELQHRVKNMLSNVLALVNRARRDATADKGVVDQLAERLRAMAKTHSILTETNWSITPLRRILEPELTEVYGDQITLRGRDLSIGPRSALALGMAIHEVSTNAAKYGALSTAAGRVELSWARIDDGVRDDVVFTWTETGGPPVTPPDGDGFGSRLIQSTIRGSLEGDYEFDWKPDGLTLVMRLPHANLVQHDEEIIYDVHA